MSSGTDRDGWSRFWDKRKQSLSISQLSPFYKNFAVMMGIINDTGNAITRDYYLREFSSRSVLEVGTGRGTMSELFNSKGFKTFATDLEDRFHYPKFPYGTSFITNDILEHRPFPRNTFDVTFTYGLLEHFKTDDKLTIIKRCMDMTKPSGVSIHYVVPKKLTNIREDKSVYRDNCLDLTKKFDVKDYGCKCGGIKFVFPAWGSGWECTEFKSKGFILWLTKYSELDPMVRDEILPNIERAFEEHNHLMKRLGL